MQDKVGDLDSKNLSDLIVKGMQDKKASEITLLDLREVKNAVADYFVLCSGNSDTQLDAISESIEEVVFKTSKQDPWKREGKNNKEWILIDYVNVVAHVFKKDRRQYYALEELWGDAKISAFE
ncbi:MAG: ribosome silencing factor [Bacteroidota bacterium]